MKTSALYRDSKLAPPNQQCRQSGSALIITLIMLAVLAVAVAAVSVSVSTTANVSLQAASWQEALMAAEAGADLTMASFQKALTEGQSPSLWNDSTNALSDLKSGSTAWSGWVLDPTTSATPSPAATPRTLYYSKVIRSASGPDTALQALVKIEAPTTSGWTANPYQWYRIRSTGVAGITGPPRVGADRRDNDLRKISLRNMRAALSGFPAASLGANVPQVRRAVELMLQPLKSGTWDRAITSTSPTGGGSVNLGASFTIDSWDSSNTTKYPGGFYDATKRQQNAELASNANGQYVEIGGAHLYGNVRCNGGTPKHTQNVTGTIDTNFSSSSGSNILTPAWADTNSSTTLQSTQTLTGGSAAFPARYSFAAVNMKAVTVTCAPGASGGYIEIYCAKDFAMSNAASFNVQNGANVKIYIANQLNVNGASMVNQTNNCANLSLYGIQAKAGTNPQWSYNGTADFSGTIWAPDVKLKISGSANFFGAVMCSIFDTGGTSSAGFHFDEALLKSGGGTPRYTVANWIEDVR
jgi:hypothetical protein